MKLLSEAEVRETLAGSILPDGGLNSMGDNTLEYVQWDVGAENVILDGSFTARQLAAISRWMENNMEISNES